MVFTKLEKKGRLQINILRRIYQVIILYIFKTKILLFQESKNYYL